MTEQPTNDDNEWADYESGPFCRHWASPGDCENVCVCGHACGDHDDDSCDKCGCEKWTEPP